MGRDVLCEAEKLRGGGVSHSNRNEIKRLLVMQNIILALYID